jgi:hypothetical protein
VDDLHQFIAGMSGDIKTLQALQATLTQQVGELRADMNRRFEQVDRRFERVDRGFESVDRRFLSLEVKVDRHFIWLAGIQMALMLAVVGAPPPARP